MAKEYRVEEFIGEDITPDTYEDEVAKKISLLYDFCILHKRRRCKQPDEREKAVRALLLSYGNETRLNNEIQDIITGKTSLDKALRKGKTQ
jgi:hypothetical protein